jgi:membrane associated rhomboid family serine protease
MAKECNYCGFRDPMPFTCKFCGNSYCYSHRLPESHDCSGLASYKNKIRESGKIYRYEPGLPVKKRKSLFAPLNHAISLIKANYSLTILTIIIISFFLQNIPGYFSYLALFPSDIFYHPLKFALNLITHMFLHVNGIHLLFNMMFLFFFGPELERRVGGKRFLAIFFLSGIIAGIGYSLWSIFILNNLGALAVGASGALFGVFACLAVLAPSMQIYVYFIPMKITHALILFALLDLVLIGSGDLIARSAHLSGVVAGLVMGKHIKNSSWYHGY